MDAKTLKIKSLPWLCVHPWTTTDFRAHDGRVKVTCCCNLDLNMIRDELDFGFLDSVRESMANHHLPEACHLCKHHEDAGQQSERMRNLMGYQESEIDQLAETLTNSDVQVLVKFSNKCSLACRSCRADDSSLYASKFGGLTSHKITQDLSDDPLYWRIITQQIITSYESGKSLIIQPIGGETLLQSGFHKLLEWLDGQGFIPETTLRLTTSLAVNLSPDLITQLRRFRKVTLMLSIDSVGDNYHCVRWPATFDRVERNLDLVLGMQSQNSSQIEYAITPVFSLNNIFYLPEYLDWWLAWADRSGVDLWMYTIHLYDPSYLMVECLPAPYRQQLVPIIDRACSHNLFSQHAKAYALQNYLIHLRQLLDRPYDSAAFNRYIDYSARYDIKTSSDIALTNSRLFDQLTPEHRYLFEQSKIKHRQIPC